MAIKLVFAYAAMVAIVEMTGLRLPIWLTAVAGAIAIFVAVLILSPNLFRHSPRKKSQKRKTVKGGTSAKTKRRRRGSITR